MPANIRIVNMFEKNLSGFVVNTTSKATGNWERDLSPFHLGPCKLYENRTALVMENAWQFSKLYAVHASPGGDPLHSHWDWAEAGFADPKPHRYPMGRGAVPLCSLWNGKRYGYIDARKVIYAPLYAEAVQKTAGWKRLRKAYDEETNIVLRDYDGYDHTALGRTLTQVLNDPNKKMGHAFVLAMLLTNDPALNQVGLIK